MTTQPGGAAEGDAIAAARRRLPMTEIPGDVTVVGAKRRTPDLPAASQSATTTFPLAWPCSRYAIAAGISVNE
jgi:hypothetical protein